MANQWACNHLCPASSDTSSCRIKSISCSLEQNGGSSCATHKDKQSFAIYLVRVRHNVPNEIIWILNVVRQVLICILCYFELCIAVWDWVCLQVQYLVHASMVAISANVLCYISTHWHGACCVYQEMTRAWHCH